MNPITNVLNTPKTYKILIIDDNPANLSVLENFLQEHGFTTMVATKGELGLQSAEYTYPDLILLDIIGRIIVCVTSSLRLKPQALFLHCFAVVQLHRSNEFAYKPGIKHCTQGRNDNHSQRVRTSSLSVTPQQYPKTVA